MRPNQALNTPACARQITGPSPRSSCAGPLISSTNPSELNWNESMQSRVRLMATDVKASRGYHSPLRAEQADQTRKRVLTAARRLFLERGYAGTKVQDVASAA